MAGCTKTFVCLLLLTIIFRISTKRHDKKDPHCIFPEQWQSTVYFDYGMMALYQFPLQINGSGTFYYDYPNRRMRLDIKNEVFSQSIIWLFNENATYSINHDIHMCYRISNTNPIWRQWQGVPGDAVAHSYGGLGGFKEMIAGYSLTRHAGDLVGDVLITVYTQIAHICPPIRVSFQDTLDDPLIGAMFHYDFLDSTGIKDAKVFKPPLGCFHINSTESPMVKVFTRYLKIRENQKAEMKKLYLKEIPSKM